MPFVLKKSDVPLIINLIGPDIREMNERSKGSYTYTKHLTKQCMKDIKNRLIASYCEYDLYSGQEYDMELVILNYSTGVNNET